MKNIIFTAVIMFMLSVAVFGQTATKNIDVKETIAADSLNYHDYQKKKDDLIKNIVQIQSTMFENNETLKEAYQKLSQLNIAITAYEEKFKLYNQLKKEKE